MTSDTHQATPGDKTARNTWRDAVWASDLPAMTRLVALVYADHGGRGTQAVWVSPDRGTSRSGMGLTAWHAHRRALVAAGWLVEAVAATSRTTPGYRFAIPAVNQQPTDYREASDDYRVATPSTTASRHQTPSRTPTSNPSTSTPARGASTFNGSAVVVTDEDRIAEQLAVQGGREHSREAARDLTADLGGWERWAATCDDFLLLIGGNDAADDTLRTFETYIALSPRGDADTPESESAGRAATSAAVALVAHLDELVAADSRTTDGCPALPRLAGPGAARAAAWAARASISEPAAVTAARTLAVQEARP